VSPRSCLPRSQLPHWRTPVNRCIIVDLAYIQALWVIFGIDIALYWNIYLFYFVQQRFCPIFFPTQWCITVKIARLLSQFCSSYYCLFCQQGIDVWTKANSSWTACNYTIHKLVKRCLYLMFVEQ
jgi:hypothetical protein